MIWLLTILTFAVTFSMGGLLLYVLAPGRVDIGGRLARLSGAAVPADDTKFVNKQKEKMRSSIANLGKLLPASSTQGVSRQKLLIIRAGYRDPDTILIIRG